MDPCTCDIPRLDNVVRDLHRCDFCNGVLTGHQMVSRNLDKRRSGDPLHPDKVKEIRKEMGLTQAQLALKMGIKSQVTISTWETGRARCCGLA